MIFVCMVNRVIALGFKLITLHKEIHLLNCDTSTQSIMTNSVNRY